MADKPLVIGIAGGSASGKTTLSRKLEAALADRSVLLIHMDRYFKKVRPHMTGPISGLDWEDHNHPDSFDLPQLMLDLEAHLAANAVQVIVVEGLMTLHHAPLRDLLDLGIFVDAPSDERIVRRLKRNLAAGHAFDDIAAFFLDSVRFRHQEFVEPSRWHADVVLNGSYPSARGLQVVVDWIRQRTNGDRPR
jgi:uridine kinase